jgi:hypothetical protein
MPPLILALPGLITGMTLSTAFTIGSIAITVGTTVFGAVQQKKAAKKAKRAAARAREDFLNSLQERTVTRIATEAPHRYVYGRAKVGADIVAMFTSGANDEYRHLVCVHAAGESESIDEVYINNKALGTLDADGFVTSGEYYSARTENITETFATSPFTLAYTPSSAVKVIAWGTLWSGEFPLPYGPVSGEVTYTRVGNTITVTGAPVSSVPIGTVRVSEYRVTYQYTNNTSQVRVKKHLGAPGQTADTSLMSEVPAKWPATATLSGFTYTVIRLDLRQAEFQNGLPDINVLMKGRKLYDPRTGLTQWSSNPALATLDYLTSEMCGVDIEDIPIASYIAAANDCDEQIQGLC